MKTYGLVLSLSLLCCIQTSFSQVINPGSSLKNSSDKYIRLHYDNDYFTKTDDYYTQGISLEFVHPALRSFPLTYLLLKPKAASYKYGISLDHYGYSPTTIRSDDILYGDRPFSANLSLRTFLIGIDPAKQERISVALITGLMGPGAGGGEMQTAIHRWIGAVTPHGWQHQIRNDVILDYQVNYEKKLHSANNAFLMSAVGEARVGTHNDYLKAGMNFMLGHFESPYENNTPTKKIRYYLYGQVTGGLVGYDATLQGGLINRKSPYTIKSGDITRGTVQADYGVVLKFNKMYLEYCQSYLTKEFSTGHFHRWGGVRIGLSL